MSLARKAGKLAIGYTAVRQAVTLKSAELIVFATDISDGTRRRAKRDAAGTAVLDIPFTGQQIEAVLGRRFAVAAIIDRGFVTLFLAALDAVQATVQVLDESSFALCEREEIG